MEKITRGIPKGRRYADDRVPTMEEIRKVVEYPDRRIKAQFIPFIKASIFNVGPANIVLDIINVGKGPARDVEFYIKELPESRRKWKQSLLVSNDFRRLQFPKVLMMWNLKSIFLKKTK